jgi:hypothetical protein
MKFGFSSVEKKVTDEMPKRALLASFASVQRLAVI